VANPSVKEVATRAGVSLGTVSNVLNRPHLVSDRTRAIVNAAITELGFVRNEAARALRTGRTNTIAYVCLDAANPFFTDVARGVEDAVSETGAAAFLCNSDESIIREGRYLDLLEQQRVLGILVTPVDPTSERLRELPRRGTPVVVVDRVVPNRELCSVSVDDVLGGELGVAHLLAIGHERIGFVGGPMLLGQMIDRLAGARRAMSAAGLKPDDIVVIETNAPTISDGREAGARIAGLPVAQRPTAVLCANDLLALGLLTQSLQLGLDVPGRPRHRRLRRHRVRRRSGGPAHVGPATAAPARSHRRRAAPPRGVRGERSRSPTGGVRPRARRAGFDKREAAPSVGTAIAVPRPAITV
jgi:LacI family transcriptional regulator